MSRKGNYLDNAVIENFFGLLMFASGVTNRQMSGVYSQKWSEKKKPLPQLFQTLSTGKSLLPKPFESRGSCTKCGKNMENLNL